MQYDSPYCLTPAARPNARTIFEDIVTAIPENNEFYIMGGALRNSLLSHYHNIRPQQRDYDCLFIGEGRKTLNQNLLAIDFNLGNLQREYQTTYERACIDNPQSLNDMVVLDINFYTNTTLAEVLAEKVNFRMNGFAITPDDLLLPDWQAHLIACEGAFEDIKAKRLVLNPNQNPEYAWSNLFAALRFMSQGFQAPDSETVQAMRESLRNIKEEKFEPNIKKLFGYVGGEAKARELAASIGITEAIFDFAVATKA